MDLLQRFLPARTLPATFLAIDLGSDFVKAIAFKKTPEGATVVGCGKQSLPWGAIRGGGISSQDEVLESLNLAVREATGSIKEDCTTIVAGLTGELVGNFTTAARLRRTDPKAVITEKEFASIKEKLIDVAFIEGEKLLMSFSGVADLDIELVTSKLVSIKVENFLAENPVGFKGDQVEVSLFTSFSPKFHLDAYRDLFKAAKLKLFAFESELFAVAEVLQHQRQEPLNTILVDVGGSCTDVGVVFGGSIAGSRSLGLGGRFFSDIVSKKFGVGFDEAELKKVTYSNKRLPEEAAGLMAVAIEESLPLWLSGVSCALGDIEGIKVLPHNLLVFGGGSKLPQVLPNLSTQAWEKELPFGGPLEVSGLSAELLGVKSEVALDSLFLPAVALGMAATLKL